MEEHYIKDVGKITYVYGVNLEEHKTVIEKQQKRIAELEKQLDQANEKIMWLNAEIDTLKSEKENLMRTLEEASEELKGAIVPKFKIGQEVYKVYTKDQRFPFKVKIIGFKITQTEEKNSVLYDTAEDGFDMDWCPEKILFETLKEAQAKLQELRGGE